MSAEACSSPAFSMLFSRRACQLLSLPLQTKQAQTQGFFWQWGGDSTCCMTAALCCVTPKDRELLAVGPEIKIIRIILVPFF